MFISTPILVSVIISSTGNNCYPQVEFAHPPVFEVMKGLYDSGPPSVEVTCEENPAKKEPGYSVSDIFIVASKRE